MKGGRGGQCKGEELREKEKESSEVVGIRRY